MNRKVTAQAGAGPNALTIARSTLFHIFHIVTLIPYATACLLWAPLPLPIRYRLTVGWLKLSIGAARIICGIDYQVLGRENLPDGPAILLSKHQSTWETYFYPAWMPREVCYVFKRELIYLPFFGWAIGLLNMIHIDRSKGVSAFENVVKQGVRKLAQGRWIAMFPEGTRIPVGAKGKYKTGGARLACRTGAPVVPIAVNAGECWPRRSFLLHPGMVTVSIGPMISSDDKTPDQLNAEVETWIENEMRVISPHLYADAKPPAARRRRAGAKKK